MPNLPISSLPELTALTSNTEFAVEESGTTYKVKNSTLSPFPVTYGLFSQTANSTPVSATTLETTIIDGGVGTLSVPANGFRIGDSFRVIAMGQISSRNNDTLTIRIKSNSVILGTIGPITMSQSNNKRFYLQIYFTIRNIGGSGVASIMTGGQFNYSKDASFTFEGSDYTQENNTTFDTTISNSLDITVEWNSSNSDNSIYSEIFVLNKIY